MSIPMRALRLAGLLLLLSAAACGDDDDDHDHRTDEHAQDAGGGGKPSHDSGVKPDGGKPAVSALLRPGLPRPPRAGLPDGLRPPR